MKRRRGAFLLLVFAIAAVLWAWALWWPKEVAGVPTEFTGTYRYYRFAPPAGVRMPNPFPGSPRWEFTFRPNGSYLIRAILPGGYEMARREGTVAIDAQGRFTMTQVSVNRQEHGEPPVLYTSAWVDETPANLPKDTARTGPAVRVLMLRNAEQGYELYFLPLGPDKSVQKASTRPK